QREPDVGAAAGQQARGRVVTVTAGGVAGPGEFGEGAPYHRHLQLVDVGEVPVDGGSGDPDPSGHPAQRQRGVVASLADPLAGRGDDLLPQPVALTAPVPPPGRGRRLDGWRHHAASPASGPRRWALAVGRLVTPPSSPARGIRRVTVRRLMAGAGAVMSASLY